MCMRIYNTLYKLQRKKKLNIFLKEKEHYLEIPKKKKKNDRELLQINFIFFQRGDYIQISF